MRGHVSKQGATYCYVVDLPRDPATGKRRQKFKRGFRTKREAETALNEALKDLQDGSYVAASKLTLAKFLVEEWLPGRRHDLKPTTFVSYETNLRVHVVPALGAIRLQALTARDLNQFYAQLLADRDEGGKGLSPKTVRYIHTTVHRALRDAERWGLVQRNVAASANAPRQTRPQERRTWSADEAATFLEAVRDDELYTLLHLAIATGMRRGELLGLRWRDLDSNQGFVRVRQNAVEVGYHVVYTEPKTAKSRREIAIDPDTVGILEAHRQRRLYGATTEPDSLIFRYADGTPIHPQTVTARFRTLCKRAGVPVIRFHDLRHTHATILLAQRTNPKIVSERLGHSTVAFTMDVYSHAIPSMQVEAAEAVAAAIWRDRSPHKDDEGGER